MSIFLKAAELAEFVQKKKEFSELIKRAVDRLQTTPIQTCIGSVGVSGFVGVSKTEISVTVRQEPNLETAMLCDFITNTWYVEYFKGGFDTKLTISIIQDLEREFTKILMTVE